VSHRRLFDSEGTSTWRRIAVTAFGVALLIAASPAAPGAAASTAKPHPSESVIRGTAVPAGFASWEDLLKVQQRMNATADQITTAARQSSDSGFAGVIADPTNRELRVYWKGRPPPDLTARTGSTSPVKVIAAAYSERELERASARLLARSGDQITTVGPRADGAGLIVGVPHGFTSQSIDADVPVTVQTGVTPSPTTRWNDSPPWWGGDAWVNAATGSGCSTGFAVFHGGVARMLSAAHCASVGNIATDPTGEVIGPVIAGNASTDTLIINGSSAGRVFNNTTDAAGNPVTEFSNPVIGAANSFVGNFVCTSGAYSGTRCSIQVRATGLCINIGVVVCNQVQAENTTFTNAIGQGDSGGPVEMVNASNTSQVFAAGTNTAIDLNTEVSCTGYVPTGRRCAWRMYYENIFTGMSGVGASDVVLG
jgi:hypothetical protein